MLFDQAIKRFQYWVVAGHHFIRIHQSQVCTEASQVGQLYIYIYIWSKFSHPLDWIKQLRFRMQNNIKLIIPLPSDLEHGCTHTIFCMRFQLQASFCKLLSIWRNTKENDTFWEISKVVERKFRSLHTTSSSVFLTGIASRESRVLQLQAHRNGCIVNGMKNSWSTAEWLLVLGETPRYYFLLGLGESRCKYMTPRRIMHTFSKNVSSALASASWWSFFSWCSG